MKPKSVIIVFSLTALVLAASWLNFGDSQAQARDTFEVEIVGIEELTEELENDGRPLWVIEGSTAVDGYLSCLLVDGDHSVTIPIDDYYELDGRYHYRLIIFPTAEDWGAEIALQKNQPLGSLDELELEIERQVISKTVAPQHPADRSSTGFIWRGEEIAGYNVWRWEPDT